MGRLNSPRFLGPVEAPRVYDRIGRFQDWQVIWEGRAIRELLRFAAFDSAKAILELGCGTGPLASKMMRIGSEDRRYVGIDISPKTIRISGPRLAPWSGRASVKLTDGAPSTTARTSVAANARSRAINFYKLSRSKRRRYFGNLLWTIRPSRVVLFLRVQLLPRRDLPQSAR